MSVQSFFIPGRLPDLNDMLGDANQTKWVRSKGGGHLIKVNNYHDQKVVWTRRIEKCLLLYKPKPMESAYFVFVWKEVRRQRDKDNICTAKKLILDALVHCEILPDDGWRHVLDFCDRFMIDKVDPGVLVFMISADEEALVSRFFPVELVELLIRATGGIEDPMEAD